jgi:hypothetical protein
MSENQDAPTEPTPKRVGLGSKRGHYKTRAKTEEATAAVLTQALARIAELEQRLQGQGNPMTIPPTPEPSPTLPPGTLVKVHEDKRSGDVIYSKVRWNRQVIAQTYPPVTFIPAEEMTVGPHGVMYHLVADQETTVPSIVKSTYDEIRRARVEESKRYAFKAGETNDVSERAIANPGTRQWSRMSRLGVGIVVNPDEGFPR